MPDFALVLPNTSYAQDLGALLPAVGAAGEAAQAASSGRMSGERLRGRLSGSTASPGCHQVWESYAGQQAEFTVA